MVVLRRSHHKQRKWKCPNCGRVRMQQQKGKQNRNKVDWRE